MSWSDPRRIAMVCNWCGGHGPEKPSKNAAYKAAKALGWEQWSYKEHYCASCIPNAEARAAQELKE